MSKEYTAEEVREQLLDDMRGLIDFWLEVENKTRRELCEGVVFSILNIFDGTTISPAFDILVSPHPDDKEYRIKNKEDYYKEGQMINDCMLHDEWYKYE